MRRSVILATFVLAGCGGMSPEQEEAARQQAVAQVEAANELPLEDFSPDPIRYREIEQYELFGAGCSFTPDGGGLSAVAIAQAEEGYLLRDGELLRFVADVGSKELPYLARQNYVGRAHSFTLVLREERGEHAGMESSRYRGVLTVRDAMDRVVYERQGLAQCGA